MCGHLVVVTAIENRLGKLCYQIYIPLHSATLKSSITDSTLLKLFTNCDQPKVNIYNSCNSLMIVKMLTYWIKIWPRQKAIAHMGVPIKPTIFARKSWFQGKVARINVGIRIIGGAGREMFTCVHFVAGLYFPVMACKVSNWHQLWFYIYSYIDCTRQEIIVHACDWAMCLDGLNANWRQLRPLLLKRMSLRRAKTQDGGCFFSFWPNIT